jgi:hypothetical protein
MNLIVVNWEKITNKRVSKKIYTYNISTFESIVVHRFCRWLEFFYRRSANGCDDRTIIRTLGSANPCVNFAAEFLHAHSTPRPAGSTDLYAHATPRPRLQFAFMLMLISFYTSHRRFNLPHCSCSSHPTPRTAACEW